MNKPLNYVSIDKASVQELHKSGIKEQEEEKFE